MPRWPGDLHRYSWSRWLCPRARLPQKPSRHWHHHSAAPLLPIMAILSSTNNPLFTTSTTVQNILDGVAQDIRQQLSSQDPARGQGILLDYVNRAQLEILRASRFLFLLSAPQRFITQLGVTDYWLGEAGQPPAGCADTGLNLEDLRTIKPGTVYDRTNNVQLGRVEEAPLVSKLEFPDASFRMFHPATWRQSPTTPLVL